MKKIGEKDMKYKKLQISKKIASFALVIIMILGILPSIALITMATSHPSDGGLKILNPGADGVTQLPGAGDLADGEIWTDKSVEYAHDGIFDVTLRAFGKKLPIELTEYRNRNKPVNAVFVLDTSSSMSYKSLKGMMNAAIQAGSMILNANPEKNHVAVVYFDRTARLSDRSEYGYFTGSPDAATSETGRDVWTSVRTVNKTWIWANKPEHLNELIVYDGLNQLVPKTTSATNIVSGLNLAYALLNSGGGDFPAAPNKNEAKPIIILMSDGAPNYYSTGGSYTNSTAGTMSPGAAGDENSSAETIKRGAEIANSYIGTNPDNKIKIYTVGYNVETNNLAWITLNPKNCHDKIPYIAEINVNSQLTGSDVIFTSGGKTVNIAGGGSYGINYYQYNTQYYVPLNPYDLLAAFREIVADITFDPASPAANETDIVITDVIGEGFELVTESLPYDVNVNYNSKTKTVEWKIPANELYLIDPAIWGTAGENPDVIPGRINTLTFQVRATGELESNKPEDGIYYTNNGAYSEFTPSSGNDNYSDKSRNRIYLSNRGWLQYESSAAEEEPATEETTTEEITTTEETTIEETDAETTTVAVTAAPLYYPPYNPPLNTASAIVNATTAPTNPINMIEPTTITPTATNPAAAAIIPENSVPLEIAPFAPEDMIPLDNGDFAVELEDNLYEIFDKNGVPLSEIRLEDGESIEDIKNTENIEEYSNLIPLESAISDTTDTAEIAKAKIEEDKYNPQTADSAAYEILLCAIFMAAAGIIITKNKKITGQIK